MNVLSRVATTVGAAAGVAAGILLAATPAAAYSDSGPWLLCLECPPPVKLSYPPLPCGGSYLDPALPTEECAVRVVSGVTADFRDPEPPSGLSGAPYRDGAVLRWHHDRADRMAAFRVYAANSTDGAYLRIYEETSSYDDYGNPTAPRTSYFVELPAATTRYFRVTAVDSSGRESEPSSPVSVTTIAAAQTPTGVTAVATPGMLRMSWDANELPPADYVVLVERYGWYRVDYDHSYSFWRHGTYYDVLCRTDETSCDITTLSPGQTYAIVVAAENAHRRQSHAPAVVVTMPRR